MPTHHKKPSLPTQTDEVIPNEKSSRINKKSILLVEDTDIVRIVTSTTGAVAYVEAPKFKKTLLSIQQAVKSDEPLTLAMFKSIETASKELIVYYHATENS